jgi:hypothetical protein
MSYGNGRMGRRQAVTTDAPGRDKVLGPQRETQLGPEGYPVGGSTVRGRGGPGVRLAWGGGRNGERAPGSPGARRWYEVVKVDLAYLSLKTAVILESSCVVILAR